MTEQRIVSSEAFEDERNFEYSLRPRLLAEFTGQRKVKENLAIAIEAARSRGDALDHVLIYGPARAGQDHAGLHHRQ